MMREVRKMPDTYINREAVRREACKGCTMWGGGNICHDADPCEKLIAAFLNAPAADVAPVVHCKECKSWRRNIGFVDSPNGHCFYFDADTNSGDFCSYGERANGGDNKCL